jgi:hypothetical protein
MLRTTAYQSAGARLNGYRASVIPPQKSSRLGPRTSCASSIATPGLLYTRSADDHNSRSIEMPGLASYDSDTFCMRRVLGAGVRKTLTAYVIAAKAGAHRMSILIGKGEIHKYSHRAFVTDSHALSWGSQFVIIS